MVHAQINGATGRTDDEQSRGGGGFGLARRLSPRVPSPASVALTSVESVKVAASTSRNAVCSPMPPSRYPRTAVMSNGSTRWIRPRSVLLRLGSGVPDPRRSHPVFLQLPVAVRLELDGRVWCRIKVGEVGGVGGGGGGGRLWPCVCVCAYSHTGKHTITSALCHSIAL